MSTAPAVRQRANARDDRLQPATTWSAVRCSTSCASEEFSNATDILDRRSWVHRPHDGSDPAALSRRRRSAPGDRDVGAELSGRGGHRRLRGDVRRGVGERPHVARVRLDLERRAARADTCRSSSTRWRCIRWRPPRSWRLQGADGLSLVGEWPLSGYEFTIDDPLAPWTFTLKRGQAARLSRSVRAAGRAAQRGDRRRVPFGVGAPDRFAPWTARRVDRVASPRRPHEPEPGAADGRRGRRSQQWRSTTPRLSRRPAGRPRSRDRAA